MKKPILICLISFLMLSQVAWAADIKAPVSAGAPQVRAFHFVLRGVPLDRAYWMVDTAKQAGMNTVVVLVTDGVRLKHAPWRAKPGAWSREELVKWVDYAKDKGIKVIPELKLLSHQEKFLQNNDSGLMFNSLTYDPNNPLVYQKKVFPLIDEIAALIKPEAIHIGHDEVAGFARWWWPKWLKEGETMLPAEMFYQDVIRLHEYLDKLGIETWMWGDMLISPDEFPVMKPNQLHGRTGGYGKALRNRLPKDIIICDWHYSDDQSEFPSLASFSAEGFRVLGASWKKTSAIRNFSRYAAEHGADGMIATTWFHVQKKEWDEIGRIIRESGQAFSKDFPDEK